MTPTVGEGFVIKVLLAADEALVSPGLRPILSSALAPSGGWGCVSTVVLAAQEPRVRSGLRTILPSAGDIEVVAECDDGLYVADLARQHRPHVVLLDIRMRSADGIVALRRIRSLPEPPVVSMLTTF